MKRKKKSKLSVGYYAVAFVDLMGQQEKLRQLKNLPDEENPKIREEFVDALKDTYGAVSSMRTSFNRVFERFGDRIPPPEGISKDKKRIFNQMVCNPIRFHQFSDFVTVFLSLREDQGAKLHMRGIHGLIGACAITSLTSLAQGNPIRGGIDIGVGIEVKHTEIYGAALARAYALESHVANYPRIVIGNELRSYLERVRNQPQNDEISVISKKLADKCVDMLAIDDDGYTFVDFIGTAVQREMEGFEEINKLVKQAYEFVQETSREFQNQQNSKIAFKYSLLRKYMDSRRYLWDVS